MKHTKLFAALLFSIFIFTRDAAKKDNHSPANESEWIQLFNGKDLNDWTIKIKDTVNDNLATLFKCRGWNDKIAYSIRIDNHWNLFIKIPYRTSSRGISFCRRAVPEHWNGLTKFGNHDHTITTVNG